jgi:CheY-like chemotaxis protein
MASILLIEDDEQVRHLVYSLLNAAGYDVREADDGKEGLRLFAERQADLVLSDVFMPWCDGLEVIREMRRRVPSVKILAMSGGGSKSDFSPQNFLELARQMGAVGTLMKPFSGAELLMAVEQALQGPPDSSPGECLPKKS